MSALKTGDSRSKKYTLSTAKQQIGCDVMTSSAFSDRDINRCVLAANVCSYSGGAENAGVENAGVEKSGAITYGKPSEQKTLKTPGV